MLFHKQITASIQLGSARVRRFPLGGRGEGGVVGGGSRCYQALVWQLQADKQTYNV